MILNSHHILRVMKRVGLRLEARGALKNCTFLSHLLVTTHSTIIAVVRSLCPMGVCHIPRGQGTEICTLQICSNLYFTDEDSEVTRFNDFFKVTQIGIEPGCQWSIYLLFLSTSFFQMSPISVLLPWFLPHHVPICHQRHCNFKCRQTCICK